MSIRRTPITRRRDGFVWTSRPVIEVYFQLYWMARLRDDPDLDGLGKNTLLALHRLAMVLKRAERPHDILADYEVIIL